MTDTTIEPIPHAVVGAREYQALHLVADLVRRLPANTKVVSGHARSVDIVAEITANQRRLPTAIFPARPSGDSRTDFTRAAFARNTVVADMAVTADAFITPQCRGTWDTIQKLRGLGKLVHIHEQPPPSEHALLVHTSIHRNTRQAPKGYTGPSVLDVTRGIGRDVLAPFAPSEKLLNDVRPRMTRAREEAEELRRRSEQAEAVGDTRSSFELQEQADRLEDDIFASYRPKYTEEMRVSWTRHRSAWDELLRRNHVVLVCYCPAPAGKPDSAIRCHRRILAELLVKAGQRVGRSVVDGGEAPCL